MSTMPPPMTAPGGGGGGGGKPHRATTILVLGLVGLICLPTAIAAWIMGNKDLKEMDAGMMDPSGRGTTNVGRIIGMIMTILGVISVILNIVMMASR